MNGQSPEARAAWCKAMREFVDLVESEPAIPVPDNVTIWTHLWPGEDGMTQAHRITAVHDFAERFGVPVKDLGREHRQTAIAIGEIEMNVHSYPETDPAGGRRKTDRVVSRRDDARLMADEILDETVPETKAELGVREAMARLAGRCRATRPYGDGTIVGCARKAGHDDPQRRGYEGYWSAHFNSICGEWKDESHFRGGEALDERMQGMGGLAVTDARCASVAVDGDGISYRCERRPGHDDPQDPDFDPDLQRHYHPEYTGWIDTPRGAVIG